MKKVEAITTLKDEIQSLWTENERLKNSWPTFSSSKKRGASKQKKKKKLKIKEPSRDA